MAMVLPPVPVPSMSPVGPVEVFPVGAAILHPAPAVGAVSVSTPAVAAITVAITVTLVVTVAAAVPVAPVIR
jgi:hypothetical protein